MKYLKGIFCLLASISEYFWEGNFHMYLPDSSLRPRLLFTPHPMLKSYSTQNSSTHIEEFQNEILQLMNIF